jgi:DNA repair protein RecO (recombination protein O)
VSRVRLHRTEAIVLKRHDFGEADRILTLYTPDRGKLHAIAKGVRRITSRKSGHVELFTHTGLLLAEGRNLHVLTQAETIQPYLGIRVDLLRTTYAYYVAELVDRFVGEGVESRPTFDLLRDGLQAISDCADPSLATRFFEIRFLGVLGYRPQLFHCAGCGSELEPGDTAFSPEAGGALCSECAGGYSDRLRLPDPAFRALRFMQTREWAVAQRINLTPETRSALERLMHAYVRHLLERDLKSIEFLRGLRRMSGASGRTWEAHAAATGRSGAAPGSGASGPGL